MLLDVLERPELMDRRRAFARGFNLDPDDPDRAANATGIILPP